MSTTRTASFGQNHKQTWVDHFGVWLSGRQIRRFVPSFQGKVVADLGCGHDASFSRTIVDKVERLVLVDVALAPDLKTLPKIQAIEGGLPGALAELPNQSIDIVLIVSVLEHLWEPERALAEIHRILRPNGTCLVNVPSWLGKRYLELSAFKLGLSPAAEMDDHKTYYDVKDLWPLLVRAGFKPSEITCFSHKGGLNTFAACRLKS
jgi:SAM-dependent methyltransferase